MPTSVLSRNTWGRNVRTTARFLGLSLFAGLDSVFSELRGVGALPAPAAGAGCGLGVGDISDSPLLLLSALLHAVVDGLTAFAFFGAALFVAFPARLLFHFFLLPFLVLGLVDWCRNPCPNTVSYTHLRAHEDRQKSRMPSSA